MFDRPSNVSWLVLGAAAALIAPVARAGPTNAELRSAAIRVCSSFCGNSYASAEFRAQVKLLDDAGAAAMPIYIELVADRRFSLWMVGSIAHRVTKFPFSKEFHSAMRARRSDPEFDRSPHLFVGVFDYFAQFGDGMDRVWMESALSRFDQSQRPMAEKAIERMRVRLAAN